MNNFLLNTIIKLLINDVQFLIKQCMLNNILKISINIDILFPNNTEFHFFLLSYGFHLICYISHFQRLGDCLKIIKAGNFSEQMIKLNFFCAQLLKETAHCS